MKKHREPEDLEDDLRPEYDFSKLRGGVRGKYVAALKEGSNFVLLAPDVAPHFANDEAVNAALRSLVRKGNIPE